MAEVPSTDCSKEAAHADDGEAAAGDCDMVLPDLARILPDDVLADVFRRLAPRWLAASRCVRRDWRFAIDTGRLLRADLLPISFRGIFLHFSHHKFPEFFSRPASSSTGALEISGKLDFLPSVDTSINVSDPHYYKDWDSYRIHNHCNGLLLLNNRYVVNPATRRWDRLPPHRGATKPPLGLHVQRNRYLVFDPALSPHYEVFVIPHLYTRDFAGFIDPLVEAPSSPCLIRVFSSRSGQWEERSFAGEPGAVGTHINTCRMCGSQEFGVCWRGALYVRREASFLVRISLSDNTYRVIRPPVGVRVSMHPTRYLDRSQNGVYFAALDNYRLRVWILDESSDRTEWMLKHDKNLEPLLAPHRRQVRGRWMLKDVNCSLLSPPHLPRYNKNEEKLEWNSDLEGDLSGEDEQATKKRKLDSRDIHNEPDSHYGRPKITILGFHPYKEVVFLSESLEKGLAYHLTTSKVEELGNPYPTNYIHFKEDPYEDYSIDYSFVYTPCWLEEFPTNR